MLVVKAIKFRDVGEAFSSDGGFGWGCLGFICDLGFTGIICFLG